MHKQFLSSILAALCIIVSAIPAAAKDDALQGAVYLYSPGRQSPAPLPGYEVRVFDKERKKWLSPSVTDAYGRYAFFGIQQGRYVLSISKKGEYWRQYVWRQEVNGPSKVAPIVLQQPANIVPRASYSEVKEQKDTYTFSAWLEAPDEQKTRIKKVIYVFDHPTFHVKEFKSTKRSDGFKVDYTGWGCLTNVTIKIEGLNERSKIEMDMCKALKDF